MVGNRSLRIATISAVSSTDSVVCVMKARLSGWATAIARASAARLDEAHGALGKLSHGPDHLGMAGVADQQDLAAGCMMPLGLDMHFRDERAGRIEEKHPPQARRGRHRLGHPMRRKYHRGVGIWNFVQLLHKDGAFLSEIFHHELVVNDLMAHVDRGAESSER